MSVGDSKLRKVQALCATASHQAKQGLLTDAKKTYKEAEAFADKNSDKRLRGELLRAIAQSQIDTALSFEEDKKTRKMFLSCGESNRRKASKLIEAALRGAPPPVAIFGMASCGKTAYLISLLNYFDKSDEWGIDIPDDPFHQEGQQYIIDQMNLMSNGKFPRSTEKGKRQLAEVHIFKKYEYSSDQRLRLIVQDVSGEDIKDLFLDSLKSSGSMSSDAMRIRETIYDIIRSAGAFIFMVDPKDDDEFQATQNQLLFNIQRAIKQLRTESKRAGLFGRESSFDVPCAVIVTKIDAYPEVQRSLYRWLRNKQSMFISNLEQLLGEGKRAEDFCFGCAAVNKTRSEPKNGGTEQIIEDPQPINIEAPLVYLLERIFEERKNGSPPKKRWPQG